MDWSRGVEFLDNELQQIAKDAALGRRIVDKLARLYLSTGDEHWVLGHVEVQGQGRNDFEKRVYVYNYRIFDRFDRRVASLAILADDDPSWRPHRFHYELWGTNVELRFPSVKILDYNDRWDWLEKSTNPFATVVMAHLKTMETAKDPSGRYRWKIDLIRRLYEKSYQKRDVILFFEFIDWVMSLPASLENSLWKEINEMEREKKMNYVSSVQRIGRQEEAVIMLGRIISRRFSIGQDDALPLFEGLTTEQMEELAEFFVEAESLEDLRRKADELRQAS